MSTRNRAEPTADSNRSPLKIQIISTSRPSEIKKKVVLMSSSQLNSACGHDATIAA